MNWLCDDCRMRKACEHMGQCIIAPPPAADAVSEAMLQAFLRAMHATPAYPNDMTDEQWRAAIAAALAARGK